MEYCLAYAEPDSGSDLRAAKIETELDKLDEITYAVLLDPQSADSSEIARLADEVKRNLLELGCSRGGYLLSRES
ncbi:MAG: hypothetical protein LBN43_01425, partial [Oscillospiraceae bacterium]|jgi:hypothetical protein|nr:hypothetical protein [Oscillospiraceae bacterium]